MATFAWSVRSEPNEFLTKAESTSMKLPYRAQTAMGDTFDIDFELHPDTADAVRVEQLISIILDAIDRDVGLDGETSNGDVLQAIAMAMAVRAGMIQAPHDATARVSLDLLKSALAASASATHTRAQAGRA
jgi:hypothetical protein